MNRVLLGGLWAEADKLQALGLGHLAHELRDHARAVERAQSAYENARREYPRRKREAERAGR